MRKTFLIAMILQGMFVMAQTTTKMEQLPKKGRGSYTVAYQGKSIDQMVYEFMEEKNIPGLTLAIVQAPYIPRVVSYGVTDIAQKRLSSAKTIYPIGPISQGYTAVAIMQLYERGKLDIYAPIGGYLKNIPNEWKNRTIIQLLQHSTGIPDYRAQNGFDASVENRAEDLIQSVANIPLEFTQGTQVKQSATNFLLLAELVEKVGKMPYGAFIKKYQIDYLGLKQTFYGDDLAQVKQEDITKTGGKHKLFLSDANYIAPAETTQGYVEENGELIAKPFAKSSSLKGFSDIWSSAENVSFWDIALAGEVLIKDPKNRAIIYKVGKLTDGSEVGAMAGWQFYNHKGLMDIKGSVNGHSAFLSRFTDSSELVCVTFLANKEGVDFTNLARRVAGAFDAKLGSPANDNELFTYESQFDVAKTIKNIKTNLAQNNIPVFALFDHTKNATEVGLDLRPTQVIVFGAPAVGTKLMQENQSIAGELPLKITVWEDNDGSVWVSFPQMKVLASRYHLEQNPIVGKMQDLLEKIVQESSSIY